MISALCFLAALVFWQLGERKAARDRVARDQAATDATNTQTAPGPGGFGARPASGSPAATARTNAATRTTNAFPYRLTNTAKTVNQLVQSDPSILLLNAHVDSSLPVNLNIPAHLRAQGDPGSYVVQSRGALTDAYRGALRLAGAEIVAYVPNNAYLVRASVAAARRLAALPETQLVLPWEPYYKLDDALLPLAIEQKPLPPNAQVTLLVFPGQREAALQALEPLDAVVVAEDRSPFGPQLRVRPASGTLVALAQLPVVQGLELYHRRVTLNDLSRERVLVSTNTITSSNYRDLDGAGVLVNVNDTGVESSHPDLVGRVTGDSVATTTDYDGHGTHVAGTIASSGANGPAGEDVPGSTTNANYRGMAPQASIYALSIGSVRSPTTPDSYLQEAAARTNAFVSNNSWSYGGAHAYDLAAASWDAAVRDAVPGQEGSQPLLAVFAAGNSGGAGLDSPATAKNVISVGAIEHMRYITNEVAKAGATNQPWLGMTDTNNEIASFSAIGNVGRGREGESGRFKPDLVAPGTFVVSTRASLWVQPTNSIEIIEDVVRFVRLRPGESKPFAAYLEDNATRLTIVLVTNQFSGGDLPPLPIYVQAGSPPVLPGTPAGTNQAVIDAPTPVPGIWNWVVENPGSQEVRFDIRYTITVMIDVGNEPEVFYGLNSKLAPYYRYESGTSMAAPAVSGILALMQQYYEQRLGLTNSPALMKALLINGARTANDSYDFAVDSALNGQGWGLVALTNSLPAQETVGADRTVSSGTMVLYDQDATRVLATGQSFTRTVNVASNASAQPLRMTLVWTDPPGNPAVGLKLVNDLDLIVTNLTTGQVYVGNAITEGNIFNDAAATNTPVAMDRVNNVENVYLRASFGQRLGASYSVTVVANRVNVNAVTADDTGTVQDFALVISSGNPRNASAITVTDQPISLDPTPTLSVVTNGVPLLNQRAGAQFVLDLNTNGIPNQWRFFLVTNQLPPSDPLFGTAGAATNIAFATFLPPNLSRPRFSEADIDLYVSTDPTITNLVPSVLDAAWKSRRRTGTESVVIESEANGAVPDAIFYAAVKAEDQQSANFGFFAVSSSSPFGSQDTNGTVVINGYPINAEIPDGSPEQPQAGLVFAFSSFPMVVQNVTVTNLLSHENGGDLFGVLDHDLKYSVLNANRSFTGPFNQFIYDDSESGEFPFETATDAPGTLRNFVGEEGVGLWQLTLVDSAPGFTGVVNAVSIRLEPRSEDLTNGVGIVETIQPGRFFYTVVDVPAEATNLSVCVAPENGIVGVYILRGAFPETNSFDTFGFVAPPGDCINLGRRDSPPLSQGRYFIGVFNPGSSPVTVNIKVNIERDLARRDAVTFGGGGGVSILDDALTNAIIRVPQDRIISDLQVAVRIEHARVADLVLHLVSPKGTRVLLAESRGGPLSAGYGFGSLQTNVAPASSQGGPRANTNSVGPVQSEGTVQVDYQFFGIPDRLTIYYDGVQIFDSGVISGAGTFSVDYGPGVSTNVVVVMNEGNNPNLLTAWEYTATVYSGYTYATFTENTNLAIFPIKFSPTPFTNYNYAQPFRVTNSLVLNDGFEGSDDTCPISYPVGTFVSGWAVVAGDVNVLPGACFLPGLAHTGLQFLDLNGAQPGSIQTNFPTIPGKDYTLSFVYSQPPPRPNEISERAGTFSLTDHPGGFISSDQPNTSTNLIWQTNVTMFTALTPTNTLLVQGLGSDGPGGLFLDSFKIEQVDTKTNFGIYFQPEESISPFRGENSLGDWKLELWDTRAGGGLTNVLLAWKLSLTFVNTNPVAVALTNGVAHCVTLATNETIYLRIDAPITASAATNFVQGSDDLDFTFNQGGLPFGYDPPDTFFLRNEPGGTGILGLNGWNSYDLNGAFYDGGLTPSIQPGKRYYLAVRNRSPTSNDVCITVTFDTLSPNLIGIVPLTNRCYTYVNPSGTNADAINYFSFDASRNALGVRFWITNISAEDVDLVVRRNLPLPTPTSYFSNSFNLWPNGEFIEVDDFFATNLPGRWYLGAINRLGEPMAYTVCAEEISGRITPIAVNTLYAPFSASNQVQYFRVNISPDAFQAYFVVTNLSTNAMPSLDLYISTNTMTPLFAAPTNALHAATNTANGAETIPVSALQSINPLTPGTWFLAVVNTDTNLVPIPYQLYVREITTNLPYLRLTNGVSYMDGVEASDPVGLYRFTVAPNALQVVFEVFDMDDDVDLFVRYALPYPAPGTNLFTFASTNLGITNEFICLLRSNAFLLRPGTYFMSVRAKDPDLTSSFKIRATQITSNDVVVLANGVQVCRSVPPINPGALYTGVHFYAIDVPRAPIQATFELIPGNTNVDMYIQRDLPLTNFTTYVSGGDPYPYPHELLGITNEFRCLSPTNGPVGLSQGRWYVSVVNRANTNADYCLRASWLAPLNVERLRDGIPEGRIVDQPDGGPIVGVHYYVFNVATNAAQVAFETLLADGNVDLFLTRDICLTNFATWDSALAAYPYASTNLGTNGEMICITSNSFPRPLEPGDWYLAVVNRELTNSTLYVVRATMWTQVNFLCITNQSANCTTVSVDDGSPGSGVFFYQVSIPTNTVLALFETFNASDNVDLYVSQDPMLTNWPPATPWPPDYPYASTNLGTTPECVTISTSTVPVALTGGNWYVAVVNRAPAPVSYCFQVTPFTTIPYSTLAGGTNSDPCGYRVAPTNSAGAIGVDYYSFTVGTNILQVTFDLYNVTGDVDLYLQKGFCFRNRDSFPLNGDNAAYASTNLGAINESICITRDSLPVPLTPGEWFLAVVNRETNAVDYCLRAKELLDSDVIVLTNRVPFTNLVALDGIDYFTYRVSPDAVQVNFEILQPSGNVDLYVEPGLCPTNLLDFTYASTNLMTTNELVRVATNSVPEPLRAGDWFIAVANVEGGPVNYTIRVTEILASQIIRLTNGVPYTNTVVEIGSVTDFPVQYYVYAVTTNAARAQFEILWATNDVNLFARNALPLPGYVNDSLQSTNQGASHELISVLDISAPIPLTPGDWFLAVVNNTTQPATYVVQATEFTDNGTNLDITTAYVIPNSLLCITWTNTLAGVNYFVVGKAAFFDQAWLPVSGTLRAVTNSLTWCTSLPTAFSFFDLREGLSPLSLQNSVTFTNQVFATNSFTLCWGAPTNYVFGVYYTDILWPPYWQPYPNYITSTNGTFKFFDTLPNMTNRYYRVIQLVP